MDIHIIDVHAFLHTAQNLSTFSSKTQCNFPVGGLHFVMRKVSAELAIGNAVVLTFDGLHGKRNIESGYKANRTKNPAVIAQAEYLYEFAMKCGIQCYKGHAEADDYIFNICEQYKRDKGNQIFIHSGDYDLCHNVNEDNVFFRTVNSNSLNVHFSNFRDVFSNDTLVLFNTITTYKVFCGDKSDNMKPFMSENRIKGKTLFEDFTQTILATPNVLPSEISRSRKLLDIFLARRTDLTPRDLEVLNKRMDIFFPKVLTYKVPEGFRVTEKSDVNLKLLAKYLFCVRDYTSLGSLKIGSNQDEIIDLHENLYELGKRFASGEYQADRNLSFNKSRHFDKSEALNVKDL